MLIENISRELLSDPLQKAVSASAKSSANPILGNVLLQVTGDELKIVGSDLEVEVTARVSLKNVKTMDGAITVTARKMNDIVKAVPAGTLMTLSLDGDNLILKAGRSRFKLATCPSDKFPSVDMGHESTEEINLPADAVCNVIETVQRSMAHNDVRYYLNGMLWEIEGGEFRAVATDGHRLSGNVARVDTGVAEKITAIIPRKAIGIFSNVLSSGEGDCQLTLGTNHAMIAFQSTTIITKLVDGQFPDWRRVVPTRGKNIAATELPAIRAVASRAAILSNEKYMGVRLGLKPGEIAFTANNPDNEQSEDALLVDYQGEHIEIGVNVIYLMDALNGLHSNEITATFIDGNSPVVLREADNDDLFHIIMPMRL